MNTLDYILLVVALAYAVTGYWQGFLVGIFGTIGLLAGGYAGVRFAPLVLGTVVPSMAVSVGAVFVVIILALVGQTLGHIVGRRLRSVVRLTPIRIIDSAAGAALSLAAVLLVEWALGVAVSGMHVGTVTSEVRASKVLKTINGALPSTASDRIMGSFDQAFGTGLFPRYLDPFEPEQSITVGPATPGAVDDAAIRAAEGSVLKVHGISSCHRSVEGSGFVVKPGYIVTNAHVVAGIDAPRVVVGGAGGADIPATVVAYDSSLDLAVLHTVSDGSPASLSFDPSIQIGDDVGILGYPEDGPLTLTAGRVGAQEDLRSADIYGQGTVVRQVLVLRGTVHPGNSGGPVLDTKGHVVGVIFAASVSDASTSYALTVDQVRDFVTSALGRTARVDTGACLSE